jgi:putative transposase
VGKDRQAGTGVSSEEVWDRLEELVREQAQAFVQRILEEEVTKFLGRGKSERRAEVDGTSGYRNGYGKPRRLAMSSGTITLRRPRVRGLEERFESRVLPLFARRTKEIGALLPELYLHGLAEGDFELAFRGLLREGAPLFKASIRRLRQGWNDECEAWSRRSLGNREVVYLWADGVYVKAGLEKDKAALLVVMGALSDGTKEVVAVVPGYRESTESWGAVFRDLKARGIQAPNLILADGLAGIWAAAREVWPESKEQRCWNHKMRNVLDRLPKREQVTGRDLLRKIVYAPSRDEAMAARRAFEKRFEPWYPKAVGDPRRRLGPHGHLLRLPRAPLEAPEDHQRRGEPVCQRPAPDHRRQALQAGRQRHHPHLEAPHRRREALPQDQRPAPPPAGRGRSHLHGRKARPHRPREGRRLNAFTHFLTRPHDR